MGLREPNKIFMLLSCSYLWCLWKSGAKKRNSHTLRTLSFSQRLEIMENTFHGAFFCDIFKALMIM